VSQAPSPRTGTVPGAYPDALPPRLDTGVRAVDERHLVFGTLAHELRNPLGRVANAVHMLRAIGKADTRVLGVADIIERQLDFMESLVSDLLEATRAAVGKARLRCETLELRGVVESAVDTCAAMLGMYGQEVELTIPPSLLVQADRMRLQQVVVNLVSNASKFSPRGARISIHGYLDGNEVVLRVADHGQGIAADMLPHVFEFFTQAGPDGAGAGDGLGLGLGVVRSIVELHGGTVEAKSDGRDRGTEVICRLPLRQS
jgi:signal transduction histidine kinase